MSIYSKQWLFYNRSWSCHQLDSARQQRHRIGVPRMRTAAVSVLLALRHQQSGTRLPEVAQQSARSLNESQRFCFNIPITVSWTITALYKCVVYYMMQWRRGSSLSQLWARHWSSSWPPSLDSFFTGWRIQAALWFLCVTGSDLTWSLSSTWLGDHRSKYVDSWTIIPTTQMRCLRSVCKACMVYLSIYKKHFTIISLYSSLTPQANLLRFPYCSYLYPSTNPLLLYLGAYVPCTSGAPGLYPANRRCAPAYHPLVWGLTREGRTQLLCCMFTRACRYGFDYCVSAYFWVK